MDVYNIVSYCIYYCIYKELYNTLIHRQNVPYKLFKEGIGRIVYVHKNKYVRHDILHTEIMIKKNYNEKKKKLLTKAYTHRERTDTSVGILLVSQIVSRYSPLQTVASLNTGQTHKHIGIIASVRRSIVNDF